MSSYYPQLPSPSLHLQGLMYGYATDETPEMMPLTIMLAHKMNMRMAECRRNGTLPWLRPDGKTQVQWKHSPLPSLFYFLLSPFPSLLFLSPSHLPSPFPLLSFPHFHLSIHLSLSLSSLPLLGHSGVQGGGRGVHPIAGPHSGDQHSAR